MVIENVSPPPVEELRSATVEKIAKDGRISHGIFGRFDWNKGRGHYVQTTQGLHDVIKKLCYNEVLYAQAFGKSTNGAEFNARVISGKLDADNHLFALSFNDRQGDSRPASHTDFMMLIPLAALSELVPLIESDPSLLIEIFQKRYPEYDRSNGKLVLDPKHPQLIPFTVPAKSEL